MTKRLLGKNKTIPQAGVCLFTAILLISVTSITAQTIISQTTIDTSSQNSSYQTNILLEEGFEDGIMPPVDWSVDITNPDYTWEIVEAASEPELVHSGAYAAVVRWSYVSSQDEWLISPEVDLDPDYGSANLSFWAHCWNTKPDCNVKVWICGDDFDDVIWDMNEDEDWPDAQYREVDLDLSRYIGNSTTIKWQYVGMRLYKDFALDDILLYVGEKPVPPELEIGEITGGWAGFGKGGKIAAEIKNIAEADAEDATDIQWSISAVGNGLIQEINESNTGSIPVIAPQSFESINLEAGHHLGKINITVTAYEPNFDLFVSKSVNGLMLISIVLIPR